MNQFNYFYEKMEFISNKLLNFIKFFLHFDSKLLERIKERQNRFLYQVH